MASESPRTSGIPLEAMFSVYLFVAINFCGDLFGCKLQRLLQTNMLLKHLVAYFTLLFFSVLASNDVVNASASGVLQSLVMYAWFVASSRMHSWLTLIVVFFFLVMYIVDEAKDQVSSAAWITALDNFGIIVLVVSLIITIVGVADEISWKRQKYGDKFKLWTFVIGTPQCERVKPDSFSNMPIVRNFAKACARCGRSENSE